MKNLPFLVLKRKERRFYAVKFKDEQTGKYLSSISTKKETEAEAIKTAFEWLRDGIPQKGEIVGFKKYTLRDMAKEADIGRADAEFIRKELQRRGLLKLKQPAKKPSKTSLKIIAYPANRLYFRVSLWGNWPSKPRFFSVGSCTRGSWDKAWLPLWCTSRSSW
jgi:hypothetical protein